MLKITKLSEDKYKKGNFKGAFEDRRKIKLILEFSCDEEIRNKYHEELIKMYSSKYDLIQDYKRILSKSRRERIINSLEKKSFDKYLNGNYEIAIKVLRRSEKYL